MKRALWMIPLLMVLLMLPVHAHEEDLGAKKVCSGHTLKEWGAYSACTKNNELHICENNFPDEAFRSYVKAYDPDGNGYLSVDGLDEFHYLDCEFREIASLKGVEFLYKTRYLACSGNNLTSLTLGEGTNLIWVHCENNSLTYLDVSRATELRELHCEYNQLAELNIGQNEKLLTAVNRGDYYAEGDGIDEPMVISYWYMYYEEIDDLGYEEEYSISFDGNTTLHTKPFKIKSQTKKQQVMAGNTAKFSVSAEGFKLAYEWQFSKDGSTWKKWSGGKSSINVEATAARNGYYFRCRITDGNGHVHYSNKAKLVVTPKITVQPKAASGYVGDTVEFTVTASGAKLSYKWQYSKDGGKTWTNWGSSATAKVPVTAGRNGCYFRCVITDANGQTVTSSKVKLTVLPKITVQPKSVTVAKDKNASFSVTATGAKLSYKWQYSKDNGKTWGSWGSGSSITLAAKGRNGFLFRCVITDANGKKLTSSNAKLTVK